MKRNAAIYARVSSDRQREQNTIASQTALLLEYATTHDCVVPQDWVFQDDGYSGSVLARPGLERLRDLVAEGFIETLFVYAPDRLSRKYAYQVLLLEEFSRCGAETVFLKSAGGDNPEERLLVQFQGMIAEYERAQIAERTRRGKRHRAKTGCVNVLSGAPYGYRYVRKSDAAEAYYAVIEAEAEVVREVFELYTKELWSIGAIGRNLNDRGVSTRFNRGPWERSTIWGMLRNPAYQGTACFGKTERAPRQKITKPLRQKGGFSTRSSTSRERHAQEWIAVPVPALVSEDIFAMAQERLVENKRFSARRTKAPTLLQGLLVCGQCGYGLYRTSTKTTKRQIQYYRCLGSDRYRHLRGPVCQCRPIRQDYLDELIWEQVMRLLKAPELVRAEIDRRMEESLSSDPMQQRKIRLERELKRTGSQLDKLLDAYQEDLIGLADLRSRAPELRRRQATIEKELEGVALQALEKTRLTQLNASMENFLTALWQSAKTLEIVERQKIVRLVVRQIIVNGDTLTIHHSIPISRSSQESQPSASYLLCTRSLKPPVSEYLPRPVGQGARKAWIGVRALRGRHRYLRLEPTLSRTHSGKRG
jgi:site-specific DNA recombinase